MSDALYGKDLAHVHHEGYGDFGSATSWAEPSTRVVCRAQRRAFVARKR